MEAVRERLTAAFGAEAVGAAVWRASRRPWWRGGGRRRTPLCGPPLFAKRALWLAACYAESRDEAAVAPEHLLYGVLRDLDDPYGAQLGRRGRKHLAQLGWTIGTVNPAGALLQAHGIERSSCAPNWIARPDPSWASEPESDTAARPNERPFDSRGRVAA